MVELNRTRMGRAARVGVVAGLALASGCASHGSRSQGTQGPGASSAADRLTLADELAARFSSDLEELGAAERERASAEATSAGGSGVFVAQDRAAGGEAPDIVAPEGDTAPEGSVAPGTDGAPPPMEAPPAAGTPASIEQSARELGRALRARAIGGATPYEDLSRVAMLESIAPGVLEGLGEDASGDAPDLVAVLAPSEREALRAARQAARRLVASEAADPSVAADALRAAAESLEQSQVIRISTAALCRRVDGFARYETFGTSTFLAGRTNRMIVYTEVERFRQTPLEGAESSPGTLRPGVPAGARFAVRLTQSLNLYFAEGGLLVWRRPPHLVNDYASSRLRDFYVIDTIDLPATLSAGTYSLKVVVKDEATGQQAEAIIPITLVADPSLARGG